MTFWAFPFCNILGPVSIYDKSSYCNFAQNFEAARFVFRIVGSLWNLTDSSKAVQSNFKAMRYFELPISQLRDFTRSYDKASYRILKRNGVSNHQHHIITAITIAAIVIINDVVNKILHVVSCISSGVYRQRVNGFNDLITSNTKWKNTGSLLMRYPCKIFTRHSSTQEKLNDSLKIDPFGRSEKSKHPQILIIAE